MRVERYSLQSFLYACFRSHVVSACFSCFRLCGEQLWQSGKVVGGKR